MATTARGQDPFAAQVRPTEPLSPAEQQRKFRLPEGFEIQLVAAEPDIQKPMNLAFDGRGRLWVSGSIEYPFAAAEGQGRDSIHVLEDTDGDGRAERITTFVDGLNIPIGLYPYRDGVVAYSIPNIYFFRDTDGDGRADRRDVLYGPLGQPVDTHGMQNAFRRGFDGWLYVNHGFRNESTIRGADGSEIHLASGNTYRLRLDGSRVEQFTWGQVNPFGSALTPEGDLITADCHSKPLSLLLRGGYYSSFGKPHDGLGFVPAIMEHSHGSTALCGAAYCDGDLFPAAYHQSLLVGNVMTSRVHRDLLVTRGATTRALEQADFITCDDPWFRPVDLRMGPDGALYIADFYNRIIGHYEVPLDHPGRDRVRGRIWRVVYRGGATPLAKTPPAAAETTELIRQLGDASLTRRMLATDQLSDRVGNSAVEPLRAALAAADDPRAIVHALWVLHRLAELGPADLAPLVDHPQLLVRVHVMRLLSEAAPWPEAYRPWAVAGLRDSQPLVRRAAADALAQHPDETALRPLLAALEQASPEDAHLRHAIRIALRNQLRQPQAFARLRAAMPDDTLLEQLAGVARAVPSAEAAEFLIDALARHTPARPELIARLRHAAAHASPDAVQRLVPLAREHAGDDVDLQFELLAALQQPWSQRGRPLPAELTRWAAALASQLLASIDDASAAWGNQSRENPWGLEPRTASDGRRSMYLSSLPGGEQQTARLRSSTFEIPPRLSFFLCGHRGFPKDPPTEQNFVQLRRADSGQVLARAFPPRNDTAQQVDWRLDDHAGQAGYLEIVDGMNLRAYAWLAVARFQPQVVSLPQMAPRDVARRQRAAAEIARAIELAELAPRLREMLVAPATDPQARAAAAAALAKGGDPVAGALAMTLAEPTVDAELRLAIAREIAAPDPPRLDELARRTLQSVPASIGVRLADELAASRRGGALLLELVAQGVASARLLQNPALQQKLQAAQVEDAERRIQQLTANLPPVAEQLEALLIQRRQAYAQSGGGSLERGGQLFTKHCAACHQVQGRGTVIGPQLDGIGNRGLARVLEDVLDPNRNLDAAFGTTVLVLANGQVKTGLLRREEGQSLILAGPDGKEFSVLKADVDEQQRAKTSIMPDNFAEVVKPAEFNDLLAYLLSLRAAPPRE